MTVANLCRMQSDPSTFHEHYVKRENVEAVFAAIKKKLGETVSSRDPVAQFNELLCKILAYNITVLIHEAFEHGISLPGTGGPSETTRGKTEDDVPNQTPASALGWVPRDPTWRDN